MVLLKIAIILALSIFSCEGVSYVHYGKKYKLSEIQTHMDNIAKDSLLAHNTARARHGVEPLTYDKALENQALAYAKKCFLNDQFGHDLKELDAFGTGENLWAGPNYNLDKDYRICLPAYFWYDEVSQFDWTKLNNVYNFGGAPTSLGHFTQLVWASTKKVGCAMASVLRENKRKKTFRQVIAVCRYKPRGNVVFQFPQNVKKLIPNVKPEYVGPDDICPCADKLDCSRITAKQCQHPFFGPHVQKDCEKTCKACK